MQLSENRGIRGRFSSTAQQRIWLCSLFTRHGTKVQLKIVETGCFLEITFDTGIVDP